MTDKIELKQLIDYVFKEGWLACERHYGHISEQKRAEDSSELWNKLTGNVDYGEDYLKSLKEKITR